MVETKGHSIMCRVEGKGENGCGMSRMRTLEVGAMSEVDEIRKA